MTIVNIIKMRVAYIKFLFMKYVIIFIYPIDTYGGCVRIAAVRTKGS